MLRDWFVPAKRTTLSRSTKDAVTAVNNWAVKLVAGIALLMLTTFHTLMLFGSPLTETWGWFFVIMLIPAAVTVLAVPGQWRHPMRWVLVIGAVFLTDPVYTALTVSAVEAWALYRSWVIESGWRGLGRRITAAAKAATKRLDRAPKPSSAGTTVIVDPVNSSTFTEAVRANGGTVMTLSDTHGGSFDPLRPDGNPGEDSAPATIEPPKKAAVSRRPKPARTTTPKA